MRFAEPLLYHVSSANSAVHEKAHQRSDRARELGRSEVRSALGTSVDGRCNLRENPARPRP